MKTLSKIIDGCKVTVKDHMLTIIEHDNIWQYPFPNHARAKEAFYFLDKSSHKG